MLEEYFLEETMITNKKEYLEYLEADRVANKKKRRHANLFGDYTYRYLNNLRKLEYYQNCRKDLFGRMFAKYLRVRHKQMSVKTGIQMDINTFGKGLALFHYGSIVVNETSEFGDYCVVQSDVNISGGVEAGDEVYLAPGAKILENVKIASNVIVGANAVVSKNITEPMTSWGGYPQKKYQIRVLCSIGNR